MPVKITKIGKKYKVSTPGGTKSKGTTKEKAESQRRLLYAVDKGYKPTGKQSEKMKKESVDVSSFKEFFIESLT